MNDYADRFSGDGLFKGALIGVATGVIALVLYAVL
tara:strand:- start:2730 stop:2834 length:105 start_codon:yes stop_codon:yes gene_type:complete